MGDSQLARKLELIQTPRTTSKHEGVNRLQDLMTHQIVLRTLEDTRPKTLRSSRKQPELTISILKQKGTQKPREKIKQRKEVLLEMIPPPKELLLPKKFKNRKRKTRKKKRKEKRERNRRQKILRRNRNKKKKNLKRRKMKKRRKNRFLSKRRKS